MSYRTPLAQPSPVLYVRDFGLHVGVEEFEQLFKRLRGFVAVRKVF
jgi:hypothetical protein